MKSKGPLRVYFPCSICICFGLKVALYRYFGAQVYTYIYIYRYYLGAWTLREGIEVGSDMGYRLWCNTVVIL